MTNTGKQPTIKLAAIDLDGTLLDGREQIPTKTVDHLITLQQNGLRIVLCSGRSPFEMEVYARQLQMDVYDGYLIYTNGSGMGKSASILQKSCPGAHVIEGRRLNGRASQAELSQWVASLQL